MAKLNQKEIEGFYSDDEQEEAQLSTNKRRKPVEKQSGLVSTKISKITRDLIPSPEEKELLKTDAKRFKNR